MAEPEAQCLIMGSAAHAATIEEQIEELAGLQFADFEIATICGLERADLATYRQHIDRGRLRAEAEVRRAILTMAKQGSTPAQKQLMELNSQAKRR